MKAEVSFVDANDETVEGALYFQFEDGWILFKDEQGKAVVAYPEKRVTRIKRLDDKAQTNGRDIVVNAQNASQPDLTAVRVARMVNSV